MSNKLTVAELLKRKEQLAKRTDVTAELQIPSLGGNIVVQKPSRALCVEVLGMGQDENKQDKADLYMVYHATIEPNLKDQQLQKEFGCVEPYDIVEKLFEPGEIGMISGHCLQMAGYTNAVKAVEDVKN